MTPLVLGKRPNLETDRNHEKALNLLKLSEELEVYGARQIAAKELTKKLGNQCKPLGAWLRNGLIREGFYSVEKQIAFTYKPNYPFIAELRLLLGVNKASALKVAETQVKSFLPADRSDAKRTGYRYYPWWSFMPKAKRTELFIQQHGVMYEYDVKASQPTIMLGLYDKLLPEHLKMSDKHKLQTWRAYVRDRNAFRRHLGDDLCIEYEDVKSLLQGVTNGAWASTSQRNTFCRKLGQIKVHELMQHGLYKGLREDMNTMWSVLFPNQPKKSMGKKLHAIYEPVEDKLMALIAAHLKILAVDAWFVHDGFFTHQPVSTTDLETYVQDLTGFTIKFEEKISVEGGGGHHDLPSG